MKKVLTLVCALTASVCINAQAQTQDIAVNDVLTLGAPTAYGYDHVKFPKSNIIIKRGGILNFKDLKGKKVVVESVSYGENGKTVVNVRRQDGKKFFRAFNTVEISLEQALEKQEVRI